MELIVENFERGAQTPVGAAKGETIHEKCERENGARAPGKRGGIGGFIGETEFGRRTMWPSNQLGKPLL